MKKGKGKIFIKGYETAQKTILLSFAFLFLFSAPEAFSQVNKKTEPKVVVAPTPPPPRVYPPKQPPKRKVENEGPTPAEKSIQTIAKVNITLCVTEGNVRINGWERNEIRAYVKNGSKVGFKVKQKINQTPAWVSVLGFDPLKDKEIGLEDCLSGTDIELDVPHGAVVDLRSTESQITIESIARVKVENVGGDISLNNITGGINAKNHEGDVMVEKSSGAIMLSSVTGNIVAFDVEPEEIGDGFLAKTQSGTVTLQTIGHSQVESVSGSGSIRFNGEFISGGQYTFKTTNGSILLLVPVESSCRIDANYASGAFQSEITLKDVQKTSGVRVQKLTAMLGTGEANLTLTTYSGSIRIKKK